MSSITNKDSLNYIYTTYCVDKNSIPTPWNENLYSNNSYIPTKLPLKKLGKEMKDSIISVNQLNDNEYNFYSCSFNITSECSPKIKINDMNSPES